MDYGTSVSTESEIVHWGGDPIITLVAIFALPRNARMNSSNWAQPSFVFNSNHDCMNRLCTKTLRSSSSTSNAEAKLAGSSVRSPKWARSRPSVSLSRSRALASFPSASAGVDAMCISTAARNRSTFCRTSIVSPTIVRVASRAVMERSNEAVKKHVSHEPPAGIAAQADRKLWCGCS